VALDKTLFNGEHKQTRTENGALTLRTSGDPHVDLFFIAGAVRGNETATRVQNLMDNALNKEFDLAARLALWARDARGGAGERRFFRVMLRHLIDAANTTEKKQVVRNVLDKTPMVGRWDDLLYTYGTWAWDHAVNMIFDGLRDPEVQGLVAKWMPRQGPAAAALRKHPRFDTTARQWRKMLVRKTDVVENKMCAKQWEDINFEQVPSLASARYSKAFERNSVMYHDYLKKLETGEAKVNASAVYPHDVVKTLQSGQKQLANEQWKALPDYMEGSEEKIILPVVDTSGSMLLQVVSGSTRAIDISVSLGMYLAERNKGPLRDYFMTFSEKPKLQKIQGSKLTDRYHNLRDASWGYNTNLEATYKRIVEMGVKHGLTQEQMPDILLVISDMEFDQATIGKKRLSQVADELFTEAGYEPPVLVFWNLVSRHNNFPTAKNEKDKVLISGFSPSIMKSVLQADFNKITPRNVMLETLMQERYSV